MKCEKCNEREATFFYKSNINGEMSEHHFCAECARAEGFGGALDYSPTAMFDEAFENIFSDFFAPASKSFPAFGLFGSPLGSIMAPAFPRVSLRSLRPEAERLRVGEASEANIPADAGEDIRRRREVEALKAQLESAVKAEDYEQAITLRDRIREMEK